MKAESEGFQTVPVSSLETFTISRYGLVLSESSELSVVFNYKSVYIIICYLMELLSYRTRLYLVIEISIRLVG